MAVASCFATSKETVTLALANPGELVKDMDLIAALELSRLHVEGNNRAVQATTAKSRR